VLNGATTAEIEISTVSDSVICVLIGASNYSDSGAITLEQWRQLAVGGQLAPTCPRYMLYRYVLAICYTSSSDVAKRPRDASNDTVISRAYSLH